MGRRQLDRKTIFGLLALNWNKKQIKKETGISERTYFRALQQYEAMPDEQKQKIRREALKEEDAKASFTDYPFVQKWIDNMKSERIKSWEKRVADCNKIWLLLQKKNPENWTIDDIKLRAIPEVRKTTKSIFNFLVSVRSLRPNLKDKLSTKREKAPVNTDWKPKFDKLNENNRHLLTALLNHGDLRAQALKHVHVTLGCREGVNNFAGFKAGKIEEQKIGGLLGLRWEKVNWNNKTIDVYESKTGGGFEWQDCPLDLFGDKAFNLLREYWEQQGRPATGRIFAISATDLYDVYDAAFASVGIKANPHLARKIHASLCHEADIPLEIVAGDVPHGVVGVGWEDLTTLKKFYLAFSKKKLQDARQQCRTLAL